MWFPITVIAYFLNAGVYTADKYFLSKKIHSSISYAFYVGIWSICNAILLAFNWFMPSWQWLIIDFIAGFLFLWALIAWYKALHQSEATKVVPLVGVLIPVFSLLLSYVFLGTVLNQQTLLALFVLITGGALISLKHKEEGKIKYLIHKVRAFFGFKDAEAHSVRRLIINSIIAAFAFASYYVLVKYIYLHQPFLGSYIWTRIGGFIGALLLIVIPYNRRIIFTTEKRKVAIKNLPLFLSIRLLATVAFILLNYAISLGDVAIINALQGIQYVFLIIIVIVLSEKYPDILKEEINKKVLTQKFVGVVMIGIGLYLLI